MRVRQDEAFFEHARPLWLAGSGNTHCWIDIDVRAGCARAGILAPAKTPKAIVAKLNAQVNAALQSSEVRAAFEADGATLLGGTPEKFAETLRSDIKTLGVLAKTLGLKVA